MICPQCAHENPDDHKFCGECGAKLPPRPFVVNDYFQDRRQAQHELRPGLPWQRSQSPTVRLCYLPRHVQAQTSPRPLP